MPKEKLSLRTQFRRWRKSFFSQIKWYGIFGAIWKEIDNLPGFRHANQFYWWIKYTIKPYNVVKIKTLTHSWHDRDEVILHANFQILVDFIEKEKPFEVTVWDENQDDANKAQTLKNLYHWWTVIRPNRVDSYDIKEMKETENKEDFDLDTMFEVNGTDEDGDPASYLWKNNDTDERKAARKIADKVEEGYESEDTQMLHMLIDIRKYMWT